MKKTSLLFINALLLMLGFVQTSFAQTTQEETIDWTTKAKTISEVLTTDVNNPKYVYIYVSKDDTKGFLNSGGLYGSQAICSKIGMRFYITKGDETGKDNLYYFHTSLSDNGGDCMGLQATEATDAKDNLQTDNNIQLDRNNNNSRDYWTLVNPESTTGYQFSWTGKVRLVWNGPITTPTYYMGFSADGTASKSLQARESQDLALSMFFVPANDYRDIVLSFNDKYINVSNLINNGRFDRNSKYTNEWSYLPYASETQNETDGIKNISGTYYHNGKNYTGESYIYDEIQYNEWVDPNADPRVLKDFPHNVNWSTICAFCTARIGGEANKLSQTITGLPKGLYRVSCQGFYNDGNENPNNTNTYLYAVNDNKVPSTIGSNYKTLLQSSNNADHNSMAPYAVTNDDGNTRAIKAGQIFSNNDMYNIGESNTNYLNDQYVMVGDDGNLTFGIDKESTDGEAYVDNFQLFYYGNQEIYLSADNPTEGNIDKLTYKYPVRFNLRRIFDLNKWSALVLPVDLTDAQVKAAFGDDAKLSRLSDTGTNPARPSQILFVNADNEGIKAGECYLIKVTKDPAVSNGTTYTYKYNNETKTVNGPLYQIEGVTQTGGFDSYVTKTYKNNDFATNNGITFTGYYYKTSPTQNSYIMNSGNMYYLNATPLWTGKIYATTWMLQDYDPNSAKPLSISIDGVEEETTTTGLAGLIYTQDSKVSSDKIFNLNGQVVKTNSASTENLPKGVYIINGKKCVVK
jgi:hypothetical protein